MAEWVRWQLGFEWIQRLQVQTPAEPEFFCIFSKIFEIFIKTTFLGVKNHEEHESSVKKFFSSQKPFEIEKNWFQRVFVKKKIF